MSSSYSMNINQKQSLKQNQKLIMSPQMHQAINLLQLPILELNSIIDTELESNPILEISDPYSPNEESIRNEENTKERESEETEELDLSQKDFEVLQKLDEEFGNSFNEQAGFTTRCSEEQERWHYHQINSIENHLSLYHFLMQQVKEEFDNPEDRKLAQIIVGNLDNQGFFSSSLEEIALIEGVEIKDLEEILKRVQTFEPFGIAACSFQESLMIQLRLLNKEHTPAYLIVEKYYDLLLHNKIPIIAKKLKLPLKEVRVIIENEIAKLDFHPGNYLVENKNNFIIPDVYFNLDGASLSVDINEEEIPVLRINNTYLHMLESKEVDKDTKDYILKKISSGKWLVQNIHQRNSTLRKIAELLAEHQHHYLTSEKGNLKPLTMKTLAQQLEMHESTIARAVANKYVSTIRGLQPMRAFFTNSLNTESGENISSNTVKETVHKLVKEEDKSKPLSDQKLSELLLEMGIHCARRTIAKYRVELNIGNTSQRRRFDT